MALIESLLTGNDSTVTFNYPGLMWFPCEWFTWLHFGILEVIGGGV